MKHNRYWFRKNGPLHWVPISWEGWISALCMLAMISIIDVLIARVNEPIWSYTVVTFVCVSGFMGIVLWKSAPTT